MTSAVSASSSRSAATPPLAPRIFPPKVISAPLAPVSPGSVSMVNLAFPIVRSFVPKVTVLTPVVFIVTSLALLIT